jgi:hypothetical protein
MNLFVFIDIWSLSIRFLFVLLPLALFVDLFSLLTVYREQWSNKAHDETKRNREKAHTTQQKKHIYTSVYKTETKTETTQQNSNLIYIQYIIYTFYYISLYLASISFLSTLSHSFQTSYYFSYLLIPSSFYFLFPSCLLLFFSHSFHCSPSSVWSPLLPLHSPLFHFNNQLLHHNIFRMM